MLEELGIAVPIEEFRYFTTLKVINKEAGIHYVNVFMGARVGEDKAQRITN